MLVGALNSHDRLTRGHSERVRAYTKMIAEELKLEPDEIDLLHWAGLLHDIGKLEVPAEILNKPSQPTEEEWEILRTHPEAGMRLVAPLREWLGEWGDAVGQHHERWDGKGYPNGLAETDISFAARIVSVADVFDVITSVRSYKKSCGAVSAARRSPAVPVRNSIRGSYARSSTSRSAACGSRWARCPGLLTHRSPVAFR